MFSKVRKTRSDCTVGMYEKKHNLPTGTIRNKDGRKAHKGKTLATLRKENGRGATTYRSIGVAPSSLSSFSGKYTHTAPSGSPSLSSGISIGPHS